MDESAFRRLMHLGFGRAILYAKDHDVRLFRDSILDACLHCYAFDPQCEGTRADYMLELVSLTPEKEFFCSEVLKALPGGADNWDTAQRFRFAACLAFHGNVAAKQAMYQNYVPGPKMGEGIGINFVQMDGIDGLLFAADKIGALVMVNPEAVDIGWLIDASRDEFGKEETWEALRKAGAQNPRVEAYRAEAKARELRPNNQSSMPLELNYEQLKPHLSDLNFAWLGSWGAKASDENIDKAAHGLDAAQQPSELLAHLRIFARRRFPLSIQVLFKLAEGEQEKVRFAAIKALSQISHPLVRNLAFRLVRTRAIERRDAIELLVQNFQPEDHAIALDWFREEQDVVVKHSMGLDLRNFWEQLPDDKSEVPMLRALYEQGPCSFCREHTVRRLIERNALTSEMQEECAFDANEKIRELVKGRPAANS